VGNYAFVDFDRGLNKVVNHLRETRGLRRRAPRGTPPEVTVEEVAMVVARALVERQPAYSFDDSRLESPRPLML
jgi:hypothetical protein